MKNLLVLVTYLITLNVTAQSDTFSFESFQKYSQLNMGLSYGNFSGEVSNFVKHGGSLDMCFADGRNGNVYGLNMNLLVSNKIQEFSIPSGHEHYKNPATVLIGLFYGRTFGDVHKSHFQGTIGVNYGWLLHKKQDDKIGGYHGVVPQVEFSRSIKIGKSKYSDYQFTSQYTPMKYDPSISDKFIDIFIGYKQLLLNNEEGKGALFTLGIRFKLNKFSISKNLNIK